MSMEKLKKCRICLVENVQMYVVANKNLQEIYEKLTDVPFLTEDRRPTLACFICCTKLKQCYQLQRKCLKAEELFAQMLRDDYERKPLINQNPLEFSSGSNITTTMHISKVDECQTERIIIKEELPAVFEGLDDIIEPKEEYQSDELEPENLDNSCLDVADIRPYHSESDLEDDVPLMEFKIEVEEEQAVSENKQIEEEEEQAVSENKQIEVEEEQEVSENKQRARKTKRATVAKKPKLDTRRTRVDAITAEQAKKEKSVSKVIRTTRERTSKPGNYFKEPYECDQRTFNAVKKMRQQIRTQTGEKPYKCDVCQHIFSQYSNLKRHILIHTGEKPYKCDVCQRSFVEKCELTKHIRTHTGEKPFKCDICQCSFRQNCHLKNHIRQHTGEKPYKCDVCQRSFSLKNTLTKHIRIHTGEKPYKCDVCQRSFSENGALKNHIRIHTGEKPYKCDVCQSNFNQKGYLAKHIRTHTGGKPCKRM